MMIHVNRHRLPHFNYSSYRYFYRGEKHVKRTIQQYVLVMVLDEVLSFKEDSRVIKVTSGEWYIQRPNLLQEGFSNKDKPTYYYIHFFAEETDVLDQDTVSLPLHGHFKVERYRPLLDQLDKMGTFDHLESQVIFLRLLRNLSQDAKCHTSDHVADQMMSYISSHYAEGVSLKEMSRLFNFSADHLTREFKKRHQMTPSSYLLMLRLDKAKQLLLDTDMSIQNIARLIGYQDLSVFYKMFKKSVQKTPTQWRDFSRGLH